MSAVRQYPFSEPWPPQGTSTSTSNVTVTWTGIMTIYKPNPFHGVDRWLFAFDEWGHRNLSWLWHRPPLRWYCNWWDRRLAG